jgi:drug/metabolite transporter (DMT)-like permease
MSLLRRSIAGAMTLILYLGSLKYIPLGVATALFNTMPIMTYFIEVFYLRKVPTRL